LTGKKRIAFDSNVHKIAIFSDQLENVKQLNFSLQKFESDSIEFEKKCYDLHNSLQEEIHYYQKQFASSLSIFYLITKL
jgi:hypothetical protein